MSHSLYPACSQTSVSKGLQANNKVKLLVILLNNGKLARLCRKNVYRFTARRIETCGLMGMNAMHIACAEKAKADFFVTCDDKLIKKFPLDRIDDIKIA